MFFESKYSPWIVIISFVVFGLAGFLIIWGTKDTPDQLTVVCNATGRFGAISMIGGGTAMLFNLIILLMCAFCPKFCIQNNIIANPLYAVIEQDAK